MNANMGTQPAGSNNDGSNSIIVNSNSNTINNNSSSNNNSSNASTSLSLGDHGGMTVLAGQPQYASFPQVSMGYGHLNLYEKVGLVQPMAKEAGGMYDHHTNLYGSLHTSNLLASEPCASPPPPPRVYKPCVVCNDKSSGYHYGVSSCEGCKGFFRRSVQKNMQYTCHKDKNCVINKVTRNRCQYCRLQKCYMMGMSKEAVRNDRNKKRKQKPESTSCLAEELTEDDQMLIQEVLDAHRDTTPNSQNGATNSVSIANSSAAGSTAAATTSSITTSTSESKSDEESAGSSGVFLWEKITELSSAGIVLIVDFAKKIPGFLTLSTSDQITLLKAACLEIMILRISICYDLDSDTMQFSNGLSLTREQLQKGGFGPLTSTIFSFAASLKRMSCDVTEYAMLSSICLISGDRSGLHDTEKIEQMQEPLLEALKHYIRSRRPDQKHTFAKMLMKLTDLRSISVKGEKQMSPYALDCLRDMLAKPLSPPRTPSGRRDRLRMPSGGRSETVTSATIRHNLDHETTMRGSNVTNSSSMSVMSCSNSMTYTNSGVNNSGNGNYNAISGVSTLGMGGSHPSVLGRSYSTSAVLGPDLESVIPGDFVSGSTPPLVRSQSGGSVVNIDSSEGLSPLASFGNGRVNKQSTLYLNRWEMKQHQEQQQQQQELTGVSKEDTSSLGALEVIVKSVKHPFGELASSVSSINRSPTSETPSSGPLSSPSFLAGMRRHRYSSPSPDPNAGTGMMYPPSLSVSTTSGLVYPPSVTMPLPSPYSAEQLLYAARSSGDQLLNQPGLLTRPGLEFPQGLQASASPSSTTMSANFLSRMDPMGRGGTLDQDILSDVRQQESHSLEARSAEIASTFNLNNNNMMAGHAKDQTNSSVPMWMMESRERNFVHRPDLMMMQARSGTHDVGGATVLRPSVDSTTDDNMTGVSVTSSKQDGGEDGDNRGASMSISQLIGGAMKIEPEEWMNYPDSH